MAGAEQPVQDGARGIAANQTPVPRVLRRNGSHTIGERLQAVERDKWIVEEVVEPVGHSQTSPLQLCWPSKNTKMSEAVFCPIEIFGNGGGLIMASPDVLEPPTGLSFGELLDWHLRRGTRPPGAHNQGESWNNEAFASLAEVSDKQARNWRANKSLPIDTMKIERVLFGHDRQHRVAWRMELRDALKRTRSGNAPSGAAGVEKEPSIELVLDRIAPYRTSRAGRPVAYGTVTLQDGTAAFGEGFDIQLALENKSELDITVPIVNVVIENYDAHPIETVSYPVLPMSGMHLEVPNSMLNEPIELTEEVALRRSVEVTQRRLYLRSARSGNEAQHTLHFCVLARAPGIWKVHIRATYMDADRSFPERFATSQSLCIAKN
jgi:hypothetical protein